MIPSIRMKLLLGFMLFTACAGSIIAASAAGSSSEPASGSGPESSGAGIEQSQADSGVVRVQIGESDNIVFPASALPWLEELDKLTIEPEGIFSLNAWSKALGREKGWNVEEDVMDRIGSLLLQPAVQAGFEVAGRFRHAALPEGIPPGCDVDFEPDRQDILLRNPYPFAVDFDLEQTKVGYLARIFAAATDKWKPVKVSVTEEVLPPGERSVEDCGTGAVARTRPGQEGRLITVSSIRDDGTSEVLYKDYYAPEPEIRYTLPKANSKAALNTKP